MRVTLNDALVSAWARIRHLDPLLLISRRHLQCKQARQCVDHDVNLSGYFNSIPQPKLMKSVARRMSDRHVLALIKSWLEAPVEEADRRGRVQGTTGNTPTRSAVFCQ